MNKLIIYYLLLLPLLLTPQANASSIKQLINQKKLSVSIRLQTKGSLITKQPVVFEIKVATQRWFVNGTRIITPSILNTVILPISDSALNDTNVIQGVTWASQMREMTLYPTEEGSYQVPPIEIFISVNTENDETIEGKAYTRPLSFKVKTPSELRQYKTYIASPNVELVINDEHSDQQDFSIGEAITQTISFIAADVPAMMLPPLNQPEIDGLSIYHKPAILKDKSMRGSLTGTRTESFTYIFEQAGEYQLPEQKFYWWNLATKELSELIIPAKKWKVTGSMKDNIQVGIGNYSTRPTFQQLRIYLIIFCSILLAYLCYYSRKKLFFYYSKLTRLPIRNQRKAFMIAIKQANYPLACQILYQFVYQESYQPNANIDSLKQFYSGQPEKLIALEKLFKKAYGIEKDNGEFNKGDANVLLTKSSKNSRLSEKDALNQILQLNPKK